MLDHLTAGTRADSAIFQPPSLVQNSICASANATAHPDFNGLGLTFTFVDGEANQDETAGMQGLHVGNYRSTIFPDSHIFTITVLRPTRE
jgi:hypothetical protein